MSESLAVILDKLRIKKRFLNQTEFAAALTEKGFKADKSQVSRWLNGERAIPLQILVGFVLVLELDEAERNSVLRAAQQEKIIKHFDEVVSVINESEAHTIDKPIVSEPPYDDFAEQLNTILRIRGDSHGIRLARQIGLDSATVTSWLKGEARPVLPELIDAIASGLGLADSERVGLLYAAGYEAYLERETQQTSVSAKHLFDGASQLLSEHPHRAAEIVIERGLGMRIFFTAATVIATGLVVILFMALFTPGTLETLRGIIEQRFGNEPTPTATPQPDLPIVPQTTLSVNTPTPTTATAVATTVSTVEPTFTEATLPALVTLTATVAALVPTETTIATEISTPTPTLTLMPVAEYPCESPIVSPGDTWPVLISFRNVPNGTTSVAEEFQQGDSVIVQRVSADGRWYEIKEVNGGVLGWAEYWFFNNCIQTPQ